MQAEILSVVCDDVEYRCEQTKVPTKDMRGLTYTEVVRSKWLSKSGAELDDRIAMMLYKEQSENETRSELLNRLWEMDRDVEGHQIKR
jgi:hypothetical protein